MAFICSEQVQSQHGPLNEVITPLVAEAEAYQRQTVPERSRTSGLILLTRSVEGTLH